MTDLVERVAVALCEERLWPGAFNQETPNNREAWRSQARAALKALPAPAQAPSKPVGWRYQRKKGWGDVWRLSEFDPRKDDAGFESPDDWTVEPLYAKANPTHTLLAAARALVHEIAESGTHERWKRLANALDTEGERAPNNPGAALAEPATVAANAYDGGDARPNSGLDSRDRGQYLRKLFEDHYWDSFEPNKEMVLAHVDAVLALASKAPAIDQSMIDAGAQAMADADSVDGPAYAILAEHCLRAALAAQPPAAPVETAQDQFCQWLKGYLGAFPGRDEIDAFDANVIRNTLNETLAGNYISPRACRSSAETGEAATTSASGGDIRWAVNVLLEQIAAKFEANDTLDIWRSDAAATVRSFKHDLSVAPPQSPAEPDWQLIETAPKDGTTIDLWVHEGRIADAYWGRPEHSCGEAGSYCDCCPSYDGWCDVFGYITGPDGSCNSEPTHWMPPPTSPVTRPHHQSDNSNQEK